jgi:hypothetical protein
MASTRSAVVHRKQVDLPDFHVILSIDEQRTTTMNSLNSVSLVESDTSRATPIHDQLTLESKLTSILSIFTSFTQLLISVLVCAIMILIVIVIFFLYVLCYHYHFRSNSRLSLSI